MARLFDTGIFDSGVFKTEEPIPGVFSNPPFDTGIFDHRQVEFGGASGSADSPATKDKWWRSPPDKKKRRKAETDTGAPTEAPLSVSEDERRRLEELDQARRRAVAVADTNAVIDEQRRAAIQADDEFVLLLAA